MYFEDLTLCRYHAGTLDADSWRAPLLAVGWLERPHSYRQGAAPASLVPRLRDFCIAAGKAFAHDCFSGQHCCSLCYSDSDLDGSKTSLGILADLEGSEVNLVIPGKAVVYASPAAIVHYIVEHRYLPPSEFIEAVAACPEYASGAYLSALRKANGGNPIPLKTLEEVLRETHELRLRWLESKKNRDGNA